MSDKTADEIRARGGVPIKVFIYNKKEDFDRILKEEGHDNVREEEGRARIQGIQNSFNDVLERRRKVEGVGILYVQIEKFKDILGELFAIYELGFYNSTILLCGTLAERICFDMVDLMKITINGRELDAESKNHLYKLSFRELLEFLVELNYISKEDSSRLHQIYDKRNTYTHLAEGGNAELDSINTLNRMCRVLESLFSIFKFYDIRDGIFYVKEEYKDRAAAWNSSQDRKKHRQQHGMKLRKEDDTKKKRQRNH